MSQNAQPSDFHGRPLAPCLDPAIIEQLVDLDDGGTGLITELFGLFQEDTPDRLAKLAVHLEAGEAGPASELAHALKGSAGTMGAVKLREIAQEIEKATRSGRVDPPIVALMPSLNEAYQEVCQAFGAFLEAQPGPT